MAPSSRRGGRRPRLLVLTPDFPPAPGGIQLVAHRIATGVRAMDVEVVAPDAAGADRFDAQAGVPVRRVRGGARLRGGQNALLNAAALAHATRFRPDVTLSAHIVAAPAAAAIRRTLGARTAQYFHAEEIGAKPRLAAFAAAQADASIAVSAYTAELIAATGAPMQRVTVIANGTDLADGVTGPALEPPTILTIARIEERYKGHDTMVRALALVLAKVPDARWVVIGDGSLRPGLEQLARSYGVADSIRFLGAVSDEQRDAWLSRAQLLAMPSRLPAGGFAGEGFGIVYLEAAAPRQAGRRGQRRRRARCGDRRRDRAAGRSTEPSGRGRGDRAAADRQRARAAPRRRWTAARGGALLAARGRACRATAAGAAGGRRVRVLYVSHTATVSGAERSLLDLLGALPEHVEPLLATPPGRLRELAQRQGIATTAIAGTAGSLRVHPLHTPRALLEMTAAAWQVRRAAARHRADVVHANSIRAGIVLALARMRARPTIVHVRDCLPPGRLSTATLRLIGATATAIVANSRYTAASVLAAAPAARVQVVHNPVDLDAL